jgi:PAS domain S-box-containing protein
MKLLRTLKLSYRLSILIGVFAAGFLVYAGWSFKTLDELKVNGPLYRDIVASKDIIADTLPPPLYIIESYLVALQMAAADADPARLQALEARLRQLRDEHAARTRHWRARALDPAMAGLLHDEVGKPAQAFYDAAFGGLAPALRARDRAAAARALAAMAASYEQHRAAVDTLVGRAAAQAQTAEAAAAARIESDTNRLRLVLLASLGSAVLLAALIRRSITKPLDDAVGMARRVAAGDMRAHQHDTCHDEPGVLLDALNSMGASLAAMLEARNASELSLRRAKDLTERLIDSANVMIVGLDRHGRVLIFNEAARRLSGYAPDAVLHKVWRELPLVGAVNAARWPAEGDWDRVQLADEHEVSTAAGERRVIAWQNTVLGDEGGEVALMAFGIDVTEQRAAQDETMRARELAEAATRSKSEFLANMSHEIRTPMNAVIGMTRLALKTELNERQRNYLEKVDRAAHGLLGIINDILDFSKIEAGKLRFEQRPMLLRQTLDHLASMTVFRAQDKGIEMLFDVAPDVPLELVGDPLRLGQVLLNLVNNAIKFTDSGEIIVAIRLLQEDEQGVTLQFEVRDTGIGIAPGQAAQLFNSFVQADASTTRTHGGTGLGLSISRKLVDMMKGRIWLESEPGKGSRFIFTAAFGRRQGAELPRENLRSLRSLRVMVVDDNAAAREILQGILESLQMRVATAAAAPQAIAELEQAEREGDPFGLVMMDWIMPSMDGLSAIRSIRANPAISATLSIIMVTAYSRDDLLAQAGDVARLGVLDKPVTPSSVLDAIASGYSEGGNFPTQAEAPQRRIVAALHRIAGATVLLVEDNDINQELAVDILTGLGLKVEVAANGKIALDMVGAGSYDAVLMDCQMPVMDGFEATRQIRAQPRFAQLPILAMTANAMSGDRERCLEAGMNEHISKPINQELLALMLAQWIVPAPGSEAAAAKALGGDGEALRRAGIDVAAGLARLHGNDTGYLKLLHQVRDTQADAPAQVRAALAAGERERARRLLHNLKGLASNLGARALAGAAAQAVDALTAGGDGAEELAQLEAPLQAVVAAIASQASR